MTTKSKKAKAQLERFKQKAREVQVDESGEMLERALKRLISPKSALAVKALRKP